MRNKLGHPVYGLLHRHGQLGANSNRSLNEQNLYLIRAIIFWALPGSEIVKESKSKLLCKQSAEPIVSRMIQRVFQHICFYHAFGLVEQFQTIRTQVAQVQLFAKLCIAFRQQVDDFQC